MKRTIQMADLFCGAGGTSTGAIQAAEAMGYECNLTAINHWPVAVETHTANHPGARHMCASLDALNPRSVFKPGKLDLLWASPECTHHSNARGGMPMNDQSRATAWCVTRWAEALRPDVILVENVSEFLSWGPIGSSGRPIATRRGETFRAWVGTLQSLGYKVDWRELVAADYGDPTTRRRLFVQAVRGRRRISWPTPTHSPSGTEDLLGKTQPWRGAREIIDWDLQGQSIYDRKRPLQPKTMARIWAGLRKFGIQPFSVELRGTTERQCESTAKSADSPLGTITAGGIHHAIVEPFLINTAHGGSGRRPIRIKEPIPTVAGNRGDLALCEPCLLPQQSAGALRPVSQPAPTVSTSGAIALVEPFLVEYYGTGGAQSVDDPLNTITTKHRHALVRPSLMVDGERRTLDIRFRMLQPHELSAAQGFPTGYKFAGNKTETIRQIGNAVCPGVARALVTAVLNGARTNQI
jgi:DNA (cytosine-5)-methyltransferase 1